MVYSDRLEISRRFALTQIEYCAEEFHYNGGSGSSSGLFLFVR